ncbi:hypothetical protein KQX54_021219 [Cotesia glomerata]|uniref:Uncharacterized protein n=1 Tax=Cotesia glomerata TaxID=32391 RepID=A0AAV7I3Q4_COTGL|nr:hypothetical protein KQX54_021219 [Cotesia glomerata]
MRDIERSNNDGIEKNDTAAKIYYNGDADEKSVKGLYYPPPSQVVAGAGWYTVEVQGATAQLFTHPPTTPNPLPQ